LVKYYDITWENTKKCKGIAKNGKWFILPIGSFCRCARVGFAEGGRDSETSDLSDKEVDSTVRTVDDIAGLLRIGNVGITAAWTVNPAQLGSVAITDNLS